MSESEKSSSDAVEAASTPKPERLQETKEWIQIWLRSLRTHRTRGREPTNRIVTDIVEIIEPLMAVLNAAGEPIEETRRMLHLLLTSTDIKEMNALDLGKDRKE